jgi:SAM-dependent methyltransferase/uncharacterized protein YbaR (Trm112 family)
MAALTAASGKTRGAASLLRGWQRLLTSGGGSAHARIFSMKRDLLPMLRCPLCGSTLHLHEIARKRVESEPSVDDGGKPALARAAIAYDAIETGVLACSARCAWFPIVNFVPVLLDFALPIHRQFRERHAHSGIAALDLPLPHGTPRPGEIETQRSFTVEWNGLGEDRYTFSFTIPQREQHLRAELDWPPSILQRSPTAEPLLILDIGAGFGLEPIYIHRAIGAAEVVGLDLNLSLLNSGHRVAQFLGVHTVIASLFAPPFAERSFDLVYSNGAIHHTYSTEMAFRSIERYRKPEGAIYVWVYALEDFFQMSWKGRLQFALESGLRPSFARLPAPIQNIVLYPLAWRNMRASRRVFGRGPDWTMKNALHDTRDRWTPRYAHRHRFNEVLRWFAEAGLEARPTDPVAIQQTLPVPVIGIGIRGRKEGAG